MRAGRLPNWRCKETYSYMAQLTRVDWAWEFLRRNPRFQADHGAAKHPGALLKWGIVSADSPLHDATRVKVIWDPTLCSLVLPLVRHADTGTRFILRSRTHLLIREAGRCLQISFTRCRLPPTLGPLTEAILRPRDVAPRLRSLACFNDFMRSGHLRQRYFCCEKRGRRLALVAQALDGAMNGAPQREIAVALYGQHRVSADWRDPRAHLRDAVRRALRRGHVLMNGHYRQFLA